MIFLVNNVNDGNSCEVFLVFFMYQSLAEVVYGYLKNLYPSMSRSIENISPVTVQTLARPQIEKVL